MLGRALAPENASRGPSGRRSWSGGAPWLTGDTVPTPMQDAGYGGYGSVIAQSQALKVSALWGCILIVSDAVASSPLDVYRKQAGVRVNIDTPQVFVTPALAPTTVYDWKFSQVASMMLTGNNYLLQGSLSQAGWPGTLIQLDPARTRPVPDDGGPVDHYVSNGKIYSPDQILHGRWVVLPGRTRGYGPLELFGQTIGRASEAEAFGERFFADGCIPSGIVYANKPINEAQADSVKQAIMRKWRGRREPVVLGGDYKYEKISVAPGESQMLEIEQFSVEQIARIFRVDPSLIGHAMSGSSITYANIEQRALGFLQWTVLPWAIRLETLWSAAIPRPQYVKLNLDANVRVDLITRYTAHGKSLRDGWMNADEVRELEDLGPIPQGKEFLWPLLPKESDAAPAGPDGTAPAPAPLTPVGTVPAGKL